MNDNGNNYLRYFMFDTTFFFLCLDKTACSLKWQGEEGVNLNENNLSSRTHAIGYILL